MWQAKVVSSAACGTLVASMRITNNLLFPPPPLSSPTTSKPQRRAWLWNCPIEWQVFQFDDHEWSHKQLVVSLDVMYNNQTSISVFTFYRQSPRWQIRRLPSYCVKRFGTTKHTATLLITENSSLKETTVLLIFLFCLRTVMLWLLLRP